MIGRPNAPVTVLAVDDQVIFRRAARELIAATDGFVLVGEAASGPEAIDMATRLRPQLVLVDLRMPGMDGVETARRLAADVPDSMVVLISLDEPADLPSRIRDDYDLVHVRKQDLSIRTLQRLWARHGGRHTVR